MDSPAERQTPHSRPPSKDLYGLMEEAEGEGKTYRDALFSRAAADGLQGTVGFSRWT